MKPTGNIGWFPRYSPDGTRVTWSNQPVKNEAQWHDNTRTIWQDGVHLVIDGVVTAIPGPNELSAGGGAWAGFRPDPVRVYTSWGREILGAGCPTINPIGQFAYVDDRQANVKNLIANDHVITRGAITDVRMSRTAIVWSDAGQTWGAGPSLARRIQAASTEFRPIPIDTPDGAWVGNHTHTGIIVRPFGQTDGYRFDNDGQCYYPDWKYDAALHAIVAIFTDQHGVQFEQTFDLNAPRYPLGTPVDPNPPIIIVPPEPEPGPEPPNPEPPDPPEPETEPLPPTQQEPRMIAYGPLMKDFAPGV